MGGAYSAPPALSSGPALTGPPGHTGERAAAVGCGPASADEGLWVTPA